jgi:hypothetical protein
MAFSWGAVPAYILQTVRAMDSETTPTVNYVFLTDPWRGRERSLRSALADIVVPDNLKVSLIERNDCHGVQVSAIRVTDGAVLKEFTAEEERAVVKLVREIAVDLVGCTPLPPSAAN